MPRALNKWWLAVATSAVVASLLLGWSLARREGRQLELVVASLPKGMPASQLDARLGGPPTSVCQISGVLVDGVMMLTASNAHAAAHGPPMNYEARTWQRGGVEAFVWIGADGRVAGHASSSSEPTRAHAVVDWIGEIVFER